MPMGLVTDEQFFSELGVSVPVGQTDARVEQPEQDEVQIIDTPVGRGQDNAGTDETPGRKAGDNNVPDSLRKIIGETAVIDGRQAALQIAKDFGISASSASAYAKGATSTTTYDKPSTSIISHINKSRQRAVKRAAGTLNSALNAISQEKLDYTDAKDLSVIAKNMSAIIKDLEPPPVGRNEDKEGQDKTGPKFVIFAPQFRKEETFEVINVNE